jgi:hypothetical protein
MVSKETISDYSNLAVAVSTITYTIDFLLVYNQVERATLCDNCNQIGLI